MTRAISLGRVARSLAALAVLASAFSPAAMAAPPSPDSAQIRIVHPLANAGAEDHTGSVGKVDQSHSSNSSRPSAVLNVGTTGCSDVTGTPYCHINAAIAAASPGDTISIAPGTYIEDVTISKSLEIAGAGQATTIIEPATSVPICSGGSICPGGTNMMMVQADNVTIHDITLDGDNPALTSGVVRGGADVDARNGILTNHNVGIFNNLVVYNTTVRNIYLRGLYASSGGTFDFHNNIVRNVQGEGASIAIFNFGGSGQFVNNTVSEANDAISSNHSRGTQYLLNTITNSLSGIHTDNAGDGGGTADLIQGNTIMNGPTGSYGIWVFVPYIAPTFTGNKVINIEVGMAAFCQGLAVTPVFQGNLVDAQNKPNSFGAIVSTDELGFGYSDVSASFSDNSILNNAYGVYADHPAASNTHTITIDMVNNNIASNGEGLDNPTTFATINAANNWWGAADGPGPAGHGNPVNGPATVTPFLTVPSASTPAGIAHLEPQAGAPANGGNVPVNTAFSLDLMVNSGSNLAAVAQSYMTFTNSILQVGGITAPGGTCVVSDTVTPDPAVFDEVLQNQVCNTDEDCTFSRPISIRYPNVVAPGGSIAFASGAGFGGGHSPTTGDFRVAQVPFCAAALGDATIHWQFYPSAPATRDSFIEDDNGNRVSNKALSVDYVVHVVEPVFVGHVTWQGSVSQAQPITLTLKSGSSEYNYTGLTTDASGYFTVPVTTLANGTYNWRVKGPKYLANSGSVALNRALSTPSELGVMKAGDANNDNLVNASDYNILRRAFGTSTDLRADFNNDGVVNTVDFTLLRGNFGTGGASPLHPQ